MLVVLLNFNFKDFVNFIDFTNFMDFTDYLIHHHLEAFWIQ